ncbi:hypothetical protein GPECTOR_132g606 [Gonium pectorale]|uniref:Uncharacterized protein n=1 Tax=Gonium pectorale TaxID=33097 RepID=A0A150FY97_GONPE|nr:hypothetical protein GPECTOR_132g606 [Gonium pectorale]|eukprot:KXZ42594.1 hypothetical protein GPECTOR_132g606 [Gonium pectorale]
MGLSATALGGATWNAVFAAACYLGGLAALEQGYAAEGLYLLRQLEGAQGILRARLTAAQVRQSPWPGSPRMRSPTTTSNGGPPAGGGGSGDGLSSSVERRLASTGGGGGGLRLGLDLGTTASRLSGVAAAAVPAAAMAATGAAGADASDGCASSAAAAATSLLDLARGPVVVAAAHVPSRSSPYAAAGGGEMGPGGGSGGGSLPRSAVTGCVVRGAAVLLDDGRRRVALSEAVALRRVMTYGPLGTGRLLRLP